MTEVLELRDVVMRRDGRVILGPVDWRVLAGEHWAVIGPNGAGKTTLMTVAAGREFPTAGTVRVLGERLGAVDLRVLRRRVGHVSHVLAELIRPDTTVGDAVVAGKTAALVTWWDRFDDEDRRRAAKLLAELGCAHVAGQRFVSCSHGERQRVLLARALMARPDLLVLDEPTSGLDLAGREAFVRGVEQAVRAADLPTSVLVTHHLEELPATTTHALLLRDGIAVADGPVEEVLHDEALSECFALAVRVERHDGRWTARAAPRTGPDGANGPDRGGWELG